MSLPVTVLVVAKAPVPGLAKTRLAADIGAAAAAEIAAAALLDTLDAVAETPVAQRVVALTGDLDRATAAGAIRDRLRSFTVIEQRGHDFAERLANAHADAAVVGGGLPVTQIGMDTPQVTPDILRGCSAELLEASAVLGMAYDGGWWVLGLTAPRIAEALRTVPMSQPDTGVLTLKALRDLHVDVRLCHWLADVDTVSDIEAVRRVCGADSRFARVTSAAGV
ncbi:MAG: TIGR04282 family arsenosugar biosynthesis glycosyltransferase [Mycobacterium sp.]